MPTLSMTNAGINFADTQTPVGGMTNETFDHYEKGTWTPSGTNIDTDNYQGLYTRTGDSVLCQGWFMANGSTTSGSFTGMPFTSQAGKNGIGSGSVSWQDVTANAAWNIHVGGGSTQFSFTRGNTQQHLSGSQQAHFCFTYIAA